MEETKRTKVKHPHRVVIRLGWEFILRIHLDFGNQQIVRGKLDILDQQRAGLMEIRSALEDRVGAARRGRPAVEGYVLGGVDWQDGGRGRRHFDLECYSQQVACPFSGAVARQILFVDAFFFLIFFLSFLS